MSRSEVESRDPCTGAVIWQGAVGDPAAAVAAARAALPAWARRPFAERVALTRAYRDTVERRGEELAVLIARETGKPLWESRTEAASVVGKVEVSIAAYEARTGTRETALDGLQQAVRHKPHGVLGVLGPYNFPAHLPNGHIVPALLAGNTVVFKPSELTPATGAFLAECWAAAGLPAGVLGVVHGPGETGRALAGQPDLDGLLFTGSAATGHQLARQFAETPHKMLALELGGNNPLVVWDAADVAAAAELVVQSAYLTAGQRCTCARRLIVADAAAPQLVDALVALIDRLIVAAPFAAPEPFMGPVIDNRAASRLVTAADGLVAAGGRVLRPLARPEPDRPFLRPALIDMTGVPLRDEEHFGPLLQLIRVPDVGRAIALANQTRYGLAAGLIGGDAALYERFWTETRAGVVNWNRPTTGAAANAPFGGAGHSGNNRPSAWYATDYVAWPVASLEAPTLQGAALRGLRAA
ncbi:succinylglutamate-semialdehyde dehydrogenase [Novosphingobium piscinae]|uniref:Succinylglutamate-semialdehyde dehydrogenase n=1 Tax=Novosphingobium piscinae TaxID=1507448 RepID=A0A7X1KP07_9SPHN|nr:succinylglutamate-semialdehyde dehydrogenase [Novosphingobium piscinae]MBC2667905.1 succinylglutamate-semialdehyde dehydrogenase [Novosphingobium piscinae]